MSAPTFEGRNLDDPVLHCKNVRLYIACKRLPASAPRPINGERNLAEIAYFSSTLTGSALLWFNGLTIEVDPAVAVAGDIGTLATLCTAFQAQFLFDPSQKWRYLSEFFKITQSPSEKCEDFIRRVKEQALHARADREQVRNQNMRGFLPHIQMGVINHDIEFGEEGFVSIKKWSLITEVFQPVPVSVDTAKLQRQIEELSAKLETIQLRVVPDQRKKIQFKGKIMRVMHVRHPIGTRSTHRTNGRRTRLGGYG